MGISDRVSVDAQALVQNSSIADDAGQRCAQFVTDIGQELSLCGHRGLRCVSRALQFIFHLASVTSRNDVMNSTGAPSLLRTRLADAGSRSFKFVQ